MFVARLSYCPVVSATRDRAFQNSEIERILPTGKLTVENLHHINSSPPLHDVSNSKIAIVVHTVRELSITTFCTRVRHTLQLVFLDLERFGSVP
jgi:hypothetical protein